MVPSHPLSVFSFLVLSGFCFHLTHCLFPCLTTCRFNPTKVSHFSPARNSQHGPATNGIHGSLARATAEFARLRRLRGEWPLAQDLWRFESFEPLGILDAAEVQAVGGFEKSSLRLTEETGRNEPWERAFLFRNTGKLEGFEFVRLKIGVH